MSAPTVRTTLSNTTENGGSFSSRNNTDITLAFKPMDDMEFNMMHLLQSHFPSQSLYAMVKLGIPDVLGDSFLTIPELVDQLQVPTLNREALLRILRLLTTVGIVQQRLIDDDYTIEFGLSDMGKLLLTNHTHSMTAFAHYWLDPALYKTWTELPDILIGAYEATDLLRNNKQSTPFEQANDGLNIVDYYRSNPQAAKYGGQVVSRVSPGEIPSVLQCVDWSSFQGKTVVDVGGGHGTVMEAVQKQYSGITCKCLDLEEVIADAPYVPEGVEMVVGDMFQPETIPACDVIFTKHVLCDWYDADVLKALRSFHTALAKDGRLVIGDAVLVDGEEANNLKQTMVSMDVQLLLIGGKMERSKSQWASLATRAGFRLESVAFPPTPTLHIMTFTKISL
jgi:SAM-dependent methyltransferase